MLFALTMSHMPTAFAAAIFSSVSPGAMVICLPVLELGSGFVEEGVGGVETEAEAAGGGAEAAGGATEAEADTEVTSVVGAGAGGAFDTLLVGAQRPCLRWICGWTAAAVHDNTRVDSARRIAKVFMVAGMLVSTEVCRMFRDAVCKSYV